MPTPTLADILGYSEGGEFEVMKYLYSILEKSKGDEPVISAKPGIPRTGLETLSDDEEILSSIFSGLKGEYDKDFSKLSEEEITNYLQGMYWQGAPAQSWVGSGGAPEGGTFKTSTPTMGFTRSGIDNLLGLFEGYKAVPTPESWGYGQKIEDIKTGAKRDVKSAYEGYIPGEILSRYGALQGKSGMQQAGETEEASYLSDIYGIKRGAGRDVRETQKEYKEDWFSGIENWLSNVSS